jgi:hypothetical protein
MPAKSRQQLKLIYSIRDKYKSETKTPKKWKWVWEEKWTDVDYKKLPQKVEETNGISLDQDTRENYINFILDSSMEDREDLERMSDDNLEELYYKICDFLQPHPIGEHTEEYPEDKNERLITKFDKFVNEGIFKNLMKTNYLVKYKVINYKAIANQHYLNKYKDVKVIDEWESPEYEYVLRANSAKEAKWEFTKLWSKEAQGLEPAPKLVIISSEEIERDLRKQGIGSFKNKIKLY